MLKLYVKSFLISCLHSLLRLSIKLFSLATILEIFSCVGKCLHQTDSRLSVQDLYKHYLFLSSKSLLGQPSCLEQALMQMMLLKRKNVSTDLCLGISNLNKSLVAHAWLSYEGVVLGDPVASNEFTQVYPSKTKWE